MQTVRSVIEMQKLARQLVAEGKTIGLVPTMGFLHDGHLSLIKKVGEETDIVVTTIFVNPSQFAVGEDLSRYPRDEAGDLEKIEQSGGDIVFIPSGEDIYPKNFETNVSVENLTQSLEGASRPTHFRGVTTIVAKLFNIIRPDVAIFGMKDFQQAMVLKRMTHDLGYPIKMIIGETIREAGGLAMSSRNKYFDKSQQAEALGLYKSLIRAKELVASGESHPDKISHEMAAVILDSCPSARIDYIAFTDSEKLMPVAEVTNQTICSLAVRLHNVRLIDNMQLS